MTEGNYNCNGFLTGQGRITTDNSHYNYNYKDQGNDGVRRRVERATSPTSRCWRWQSLLHLSVVIRPCPVKKPLQS